MEIPDQLRKLMEDLKTPLPELQDMAKLAKEALQQTKPIVSKSVIIDGVPCVAQQYTDKVTVLFPTKESVLAYYNEVGSIKVKWYKKIFKW